MAKAACFLIVLAFVQATLAVKTPTLQLNDGNQMPVIGLGTYGTDEDIAKMPQAVKWALDAGYRHIDTATLYQNEEQIGKALQEYLSKGIVNRSELFITDKLWNNRHAQEQVVPALRESLRLLKLDYVDLYLIHSPAAQNDAGIIADIDFLETWKGMEEAKRLGLAKSIGVSNFDMEQVDRLYANSKIKPAVNQIEVNPTLTNTELVDHCKKLGIVVTAWSPLGFLVKRDAVSIPPPKPSDPVLQAMAKKYGKTVIQVVLRYLVDRGLIVIPKSTNKGRIEENIKIFDFKLTKEEIEQINKYDRNRGVYD